MTDNRGREVSRSDADNETSEDATILNKTERSAVQVDVADRRLRLDFRRAPGGKRELFYLAVASIVSLGASGASTVYVILIDAAMTAFAVCAASALIAAISSMLVIRSYFTRKEFVGAAHAVQMDLHILPERYAVGYWDLDESEARHNLVLRIADARRIRDGLLVSGDLELALRVDRAIHHVFRGE